MKAGRGPGRGRLRAVVSAQGIRVWQADWTDATGQRRRRTLGANRRDAERALSRIIRDRDLALAGVAPHQTGEALLADVLARYLAFLRAERAPRTARESEAALGRIVAALRVRRVQDLTKPLLQDYRASRQRAGAANKTVNNDVAALLAALNLAVSEGRIAHNPLDGLPMLPVTALHRRRMPRAIHDLEAARIVRAALEIDREAEGIPRTPLLRMLLATGARWGELTRARWADLDVDRGLLELRAETTKTRRGRIIPLGPESVELLMEMRREQTRILRREPGREDAIFLAPRGRPWARDTANFRRFLYRVMELAGVSRRDATGRVVHVHALRHTFATRLARNGVPIQIAQKLTGHASVQLLMDVYVHLDVEDARKAIEGLTPLPGMGNV